jgi:serine/threonine-protein kinase RsbW
MAESKHARILARRKAEDFVGREVHTERLFSHARSSTSGLILSAVPGAGATELLRQTYDRLFYEHHDTIPFYFEIRPSIGAAREIAESFLKEFIRQLVAFRRRESAVVRSVADLNELAELSVSVNAIWIDRLIETARRAPNGRDFVRTCLAAPVRAAAHDAQTFVMIDGVHLLPDIENGAMFFDVLNEIFTHGGVPHVFSGYRRFLFGKFDSPQLELGNLDFVSAGRLAEALAREAHMDLADPARDLIAAQLGGNPLMIRHVICTAQDSGVSLDSFEAVEKAYTEAIFGGRIGTELDDVFARVTGTPDRERAVLAFLAEIQKSEDGRMARETFPWRLTMTESETRELLERLNVLELVRLTPGHVEMMLDDLVLTDYIDSRVRLSSAESRALVFGSALARNIERAPELMAKLYRIDASAGIRELLTSFAGQAVPLALFEYRQFRDEIKGLSDAEAMNAAGAGGQIFLPKIFFAASAAAFYPEIAEVAESEHAAVALGFQQIGEDPTEEIVWIAAEIESKLEASRELTESWLDHLETAAAACDFKSYRLWLITPEGFSADALAALKKRNAYGSSRRQVSLLRRFLEVPEVASDRSSGNEYEIVIPMDADAELIAAHSVEEIARRHNLDPKSINQIKTALVEACINASEHSLSPDRKIYQRFRIEDDRVVLTISNRGLRLASHATGEPSTEGRRGWGLRLMRNLMDEVSIEEVDDGTRIVMTKFTPERKAA